MHVKSPLKQEDEVSKHGNLKPALEANNSFTRVILITLVTVCLWFVLFSPVNSFSTNLLSSTIAMPIN